MRDPQHDPDPLDDFELDYEEEMEQSRDLDEEFPPVSENFEQWLKTLGRWAR